MLTWPFQSDAAVLRRVRAGDHASFRILVDRYVHVIRGVALAYLSNPHDADDVVQDTFLRAFEAREKLTQPTNLGAWLITVAKNRCFDLLRKRTRESGVPATGAEPAVTPAFEREELYRALWDHVSRLDPGMREVLMLHYFSRKSAREIAGLLEITPDAAAKRLQRARINLGQRMVDQIGDELGGKADRKRDAESVMGVLAAQVPTFSPLTQPALLAGSITALKVASLAAIALIAIASFQQSHRSNLVAQRLSQSSLPGEDRAIAKPDVPQTTTKEPANNPTETTSPSDAAGLSDVPTGRVRGIVVDTKGQPLPGANVTIKRIDWPEELKAAGLDIGESGKTASTYTRSTTTDAAGTFEFTKFPLRGESDGYYGSYELFASKGTLAAKSKVDDQPWLYDQFIEIPVNEAYSISGTVRDVDGNPLANATILPNCRTYDIPIAWVLWGGIDHARSDDSGRFSCTNLIRGVYELKTIATGYTDSTVTGIRVDSENVEITLERPLHGSFELSGLVSDTDQRPVPEIPIIARRVLNTEKQKVAASQTQSKPDGSFTLQNLPEGKYSIHIENSDYVLLTPSGIVAVSQDTKPLQLTVVRGATLSGRVTFNAESFGWFGVSAKTDEAAEPQYARIEKDGAYELRGLPSGRYTVSIKDYPTTAPQAIEIEVGNNYPNVDFAIQPIWRVVGRVSDGANNPVAGACVVALTGREIYESQHRWGSPNGASKSFTDADGNFTLARFDTTPVHVQAITNGMVSTIAGPLAQQSAQPIELKMMPFGSVDGRVVFSSARSNSPAFLIAVPLRSSTPILFAQPNWSDNYSGVSDLEPRMAAGIKTRSSFSGKFRFPTMPAGEYEIHAYTFGMTVAPNPDPVTITVTPQQKITDLEVRLPKLDGGSVEGKLTMKGEPLRGQKVEIQRDFDAKTFGSWSTWTDESGEFRIEGIQPGRHELNAVRYMSGRGENGLREIEHHFDISEGDELRFDFDMASGTSKLSGAVTVDGVPIAGVTLSIKKEGPANSTPQALRAETDQAGRFTVDGIDPGIYDVQAIRYVRQDKPEKTFSQLFQIEVLEQPENDVKLEVTAGGMVGKLAGVHPGETAIVALLPGVIDAGEMSLKRMQELKEKIAYQDRVEPNGGYNVMFVERGTYTAFAIAYPENSGDDDTMFAELRYQAEVVEIPAGKSLVMDFALE